MTLYYLNGEARTPLVDIAHANMFQRRGKSTPVFGMFSPSLGDVFDPAIDAMPVIISGVEGAITLNVDSIDFASLGAPGDEAWDGEDLEASGIALQTFNGLTLAAVWARQSDGSQKTQLTASNLDIGRVGMQQQVIVAAVIALGESLSPAYDLGTGRVVGLQTPAGLEGASITFEASFDGVTYAPLYEAAGTEKTITVGASRFVAISPADFLGVRRIKVRTGTLAAAQVQAAARTIQLITQP